MKIPSTSLERRRWTARVIPASVATVALLGACSQNDAIERDTAPSAASAASVSSAPTPTPPIAETIAPATTTKGGGAPTTEPTTEPTPEPTPQDADAIAATRAMFDRISPDLPGCTVAASRSGEVVYAEAFGASRLEPLEPMTIETVVDVGSTSKQFTATALLLLAERGQVNLDAPLSTYLADLPAWADEPTMRQLMHHESGIPDYIELLAGRGFAFTEVTTDADTLTALGEVAELDFTPGTSWEYSNSNYFLIGQVVLEVTGDDLGRFLADEVFGPLDLAMVMDPTAAIPTKAMSYEGSGGQVVVADSPWQQLGDGGVQTTPSELVRWAAEYWDPVLDGLGIDDRLDRAVPVPGEVGVGAYGAGIFATDDDELGQVLTHSGGWGGFVTVFALAPDLEVAIAATCTSPDSASRLVTDGDPERELLDIWAATV